MTGHWHDGTCALCTYCGCCAEANDFGCHCPHCDCGDAADG